MDVAMRKDNVLILNPTYKALVGQLFLQSGETAVSKPTRFIRIAEKYTLWVVIQMSGTQLQLLSCTQRICPRKSQTELMVRDNLGEPQGPPKTYFTY